MTTNFGATSVSVIHHSAICVRDVDESVRFWRDGLGFDIVMDERFQGDWPTMLHAPSTSLRAVFLGDPAHPESGIVELVDLGDVSDPKVSPDAVASTGFLLVSVITDLGAALDRLAALGLGGRPRRVEVAGVGMAVVQDPAGVLVELVDSGATSNLQQISSSARTKA